MAKDRRSSDPWGYGLEAYGKPALNGALPCIECGDITTGKHHVVPVAMGGTRQVPMCHVCHRLAHDTSLSALIRVGRKRKISGKPIKHRIDPSEERAIIVLSKYGFRQKEIAEQLNMSVRSVSSILDDRMRNG